MRNSREPEVFNLTRAQIATKLLRIDGRPVNLTDYPMFLAIYNGNYPSMVLKTSRQVGKSTTLCNFAISESIAIEHFKTLFISPTQEQTHKFSTERVGKTLSYSPLVKEHFMVPGQDDRVLVRSMKGGSTIYFSYAKEDADRVRGITADRMCLDEIQDINLEAVVPVVQECMANSKYEYEMFCGTPKSMENQIEGYWQRSSQTEWAIKCDSCGRHSIILSENQLTNDGPICQNCKSLLNPRHGVWVDMNKKPFITKGFHISRAIMPEAVPAAWGPGESRDRAKAKWAKVMAKLEGSNAIPLPVFRNEVLGISDSAGSRMLNLSDLEALCNGLPLSPVPTAENMKDIVAVGAGIDWSGGGTEIKSRTVLTIQGIKADGRIRLLHYAMFPGTSAEQDVMQIITLLQHYDRVMPLWVAGDAGEGNVNIDMLRNRFRQPRRVLKIRYTGSQRQYVTYSAEAVEYRVKRTVAVDNMMTELKVGNYQFPTHKESVDTLFKDIMNEHVEITRQGEKRWTHADNKPDDGLHSLIFGKLAIQIGTRKLDLGSAI